MSKFNSRKTRFSNERYETDKTIFWTLDELDFFWTLLELIHDDSKSDLMLN